MSKLAIIGTAGRGDDGPKLAARTEEYYHRMLDCVRHVAGRVGAKTLVSGGAAWADYLAIALFLHHPDDFTLELELPAHWIEDPHLGAVYYDTGVRDWEANPGGTSNHYLRKMSEQCFGFSTGYVPFEGMWDAQKHSRCTLRVTHGFHARNLLVAQADHCLAMTFGDGKQLKDGGTAHTMRAFLERPNHGEAYHLDLNTLKLWKGATV